MVERRGELYNDLHPKKSTKNTGYKNKQKALQTIKIIKNRSKKYQFSVINTMYYRAKHHKYQTKEMREAMRVYKGWLENYKREREQYLKLKTGE
jgi:hypothetical protein